MSNTTRHVISRTLSPEAQAVNRKSIEEYLGSGHASDPLWADPLIHEAYMTGDVTLFYNRIKELISYNSVPRKQAEALSPTTVEKMRAAIILGNKQPSPTSR